MRSLAKVEVQVDQLQVEDLYWIPIDQGYRKLTEVFDQPVRRMLVRKTLDEPGRRKEDSEAVHSYSEGLIQGTLANVETTDPRNTCHRMPRRPLC
jgi:uncharacterized cysteine cluster protein YcgN (CxxCxxCC family)